MTVLAAREPLPAWVCRGALILGVVLLLRGLTVLQTGVMPSLPVAGLADLATAAFLVLLAPLLRPWALRLPAVGLIVLGHYAGGEHITTHGTLFRVAHLHHLLDAVFIASSVEGESKGWLGIYVLAGLPLLKLLGGPPPPASQALARLGLCLALIAGYGIAVDSLTRPANNVVLGSIAQVPGALLGTRTPASVPEDRRRATRAPAGERPATVGDEGGGETGEFFQREESGTVAVEPDNVLLILIEGLSAAYLPDVARYHGLEPAIRLPGLERALRARGFLVYRNVLSLQRQTNRGTYALLCGDYPRITTVTAKMSEIASEARPVACLPALLAAAGYRTAYIQAAPLEFMQKDRFMAQAGFQTVIGLGAAEEGREATAERDDEAVSEGWGPTDDRFFPAALVELRRLAGPPGPWFATLLNVGTHHPFSAQGGSDRARDEAGMLPTPEGRQATRNRAFERMAGALEKLLDALERESLLADTAIFIASDESGALLRPDREPGLLDGNFGMLAVRLPKGRTRDRLAERDTIAAQIDVPVTIADLVDLPDRGRMVGRSLLKQRSDEPRHLVFGDTYAGRTFFLRSSGELISCDETFLRCQSWRFDPDRLVGSLEPSGAEPFLDLAARQRLAEATSRIRPAEDEPAAAEDGEGDGR